MFNEDTLVIITKVAIIAAILFVAVPGAIWLAIKYIEFISWVGGL